MDTIVDGYVVAAYKAGTESNIIKGPGIYQKLWIDIREYPTYPYHAKLSEREVNRGGRCRLQILVTIVAHESFGV